MKKTLKSILLIILVLSLVLTLACSNKKATSEDEQGENDGIEIDIDGDGIADRESNATNSNGGSGGTSGTYSNKASSGGYAETKSQNINVQKIDMKGKEIIILANEYYEGKMDQTSAGRSLMQRLSEIEKSFNCKIKISQIEFATFFAKFNSGQLYADIVQNSPGSSAQFFKSLSVIGLDGYGIDFNSSDYAKDLLTFFTFKGKHYGLIKKSEGIESIRYADVMFMNKELIDKYSKVKSDAIYKLVKDKKWTWEAFEGICKDIARDTNGDGKNDIYGTVNGDQDHFLWTSLITSNASSTIKESTGLIDINLTDSKTIEALNMWKKWDRDDKILLTTPNPFIDPTINFIKGNVAFIANYVERADAQATGDYVKNLGSKIGLVPIPMGPKSGGKYYSEVPYAQGWSIPTVVKKNDKDGVYTKQVVEILKALCKPYYDDSQLKKVVELEYSKIVNDEGSLNTLYTLADSTKVTHLYTSGIRHLLNNDLINKVSIEGNSVENTIAQVNGTYKKLCEDLYKLIN